MPWEYILKPGFSLLFPIHLESGDRLSWQISVLKLQDLQEALSTMVQCLCLTGYTERLELGQSHSGHFIQQWRFMTDSAIEPRYSLTNWDVVALRVKPEG